MPAAAGPVMGQAASASSEASGMVGIVSSSS